VSRNSHFFAVEIFAACKPLPPWIESGSRCTEKNVAGRERQEERKREREIGVKSGKQQEERWENRKVSHERTFK
jgi:hypothetical protein